jgi:membrane-associated protein
MTDWLLLQLANYGAVLLFGVTFLSCLALPVPSSLLMLAGGAFVASGDLAITSTAPAALAGAILGDQLGFFFGHTMQARLQRQLATRPKRAALLKQAQSYLETHGGWSIFFSRWLFSPLGPYINIAAGLADYSRARFTLWGILGEMVWVSLYVTLGYVFAANISTVAELASDISGLLAGLALSVLSGLWLRQRLRATSAAKGHSDV